MSKKFLKALVALSMLASSSLGYAKGCGPYPRTVERQPACCPPPAPSCAPTYSAPIMAPMAPMSAPIMAPLGGLGLGKFGRTPNTNCMVVGVEGALGFKSFKDNNKSIFTANPELPAAATYQMFNYDKKNESRGVSMNFGYHRNDVGRFNTGLIFGWFESKHKGEANPQDTWKAKILYGMIGGIMYPNIDGIPFAPYIQIGGGMGYSKIDTLINSSSSTLMGASQVSGVSSGVGAPGVGSLAIGGLKIWRPVFEAGAGLSFSLAEAMSVQVGYKLFGVLKYNKDSKYYKTDTAIANSVAAAQDVGVKDMKMLEHTIVLRLNVMTC